MKFHGFHYDNMYVKHTTINCDIKLMEDPISHSVDAASIQKIIL